MALDSRVDGSPRSKVKPELTMSSAERYHNHDDVMPWKWLPYYWLCFQGIRFLMQKTSNEWAVIYSFYCTIQYVEQKSTYWWFDTTGACLWGLFYPMKIYLTKRSGDRLNVKMASYLLMDRESHYKDKTVSWPSNLYNSNSVTWKHSFPFTKGPRIP